MNLAEKPARLLPLIVACALFIENMDSTVISTSLPAMAKDLGTDPIALKLAMTAYMLSLAVFIPISGWVADRFGSRTIFASAIGVFLLGSACCGFSTGLGTLVLSRALQGVGGAMMVPVGRLVLLRSVPKNQLVQALSWLTIPAMVGPVVGPPLGGFITTYFHWRWIFFVNLPIGLIGIVLARKFIPQIKEEVGALDGAGFALTGIGLATAMFGFSTMGRHLLPLWLSAASFILGSVLLVAYVMYWKRHEQHALLDLRLFALNTFRAGVAGGSLFRLGIGAVPFLLPLMLQLGFGLNPLQSGSLTFISTVGAMFMKTIAAWVIKRWGFRRVLVTNALLASMMLAAYGLFRPGLPHAVLMVVLLVSGCFRSLQFTAINAISYAEVDQSRMSQATSLSSMMQQLALGLGVAIGGYLLEIAGAIRRVAPTEVHNFYWAFAAIGLISASSVWWMLRLPRNAGAEMAGRAKIGKEVDDQPKTVKFPQT